MTGAEGSYVGYRTTYFCPRRLSHKGNTRMPYPVSEPLTKEDLKEALSNLATKDDIARLRKDLVAIMSVRPTDEENHVTDETSYVDTKPTSFTLGTRTCKVEHWKDVLPLLCRELHERSTDKKALYDGLLKCSIFSAKQPLPRVKRRWEFVHPLKLWVLKYHGADRTVELARRIIGRLGYKPAQLTFRCHLK